MRLMGPQEAVITYVLRVTVTDLLTHFTSQVDL